MFATSNFRAEKFASDQIFGCQDTHFDNSLWSLAYGQNAFRHFQKPFCRKARILLVYGITSYLWQQVHSFEFGNVGLQPQTKDRENYLKVWLCSRTSFWTL